MSPPHQEIDASINKQDVQESVAERADADEQPQEAQEEVKPEKPQPKKEAPKAEPKPVSHPIGCENYRHLVNKYNWNADVMLRVMKAESSCNPNAVGDDYPIRGLHAPSCGLMQVRTIGDRPSCDQLKNPEVNIEWAWKIYQSQGYNAWTVCRTVVRCY